MDPLIILFAALLVFMLFSSRRTRRRQQERATFQDELFPGQEVVTASGLLGTVTRVDGDIVTLEHAPGSVTTWLRAAIVRPYEPVEDLEDATSAETTTTTDDDGSTTPGLLDKP